MNPAELIEREVHKEAPNHSYSVRELPEQCPFSKHKLFIVIGPTKRFDFPTLPGGSMGYFVANGHRATRLSREHKEIEAVLSAEWEHLHDADPVLLATLILKFYDGGIRKTHHVLKDLDALLNFGESQEPFRAYQLNEKQLSMVQSELGSTELTQEEDVLRIRAVTLCGWMHDKRNLGVEAFTINRDGHPSFQKRQLLSRRIFTRVPMIRY